MVFLVKRVMPFFRRGAGAFEAAFTALVTFFLGSAAAAALALSTTLVGK